MAARSKILMENIEEVRRRGVFEGQVLTKLDDLKTGVTNLAASYTSIELRVRSLEAANSSITGGLKIGHLLVILLTNIVVGVVVYTLTHP